MSRRSGKVCVALVFPLVVAAAVAAKPDPERIAREVTAAVSKAVVAGDEAALQRLVAADAQQIRDYLLEGASAHERLHELGIPARTEVNMLHALRAGDKIVCEVRMAVWVNGIYAGSRPSALVLGRRKGRWVIQEQIRPYKAKRAASLAVLLALKGPDELPTALHGLLHQAEEPRVEPDKVDRELLENYNMQELAPLFQPGAKRSRAGWVTGDGRVMRGFNAKVPASGLRTALVELSWAEWPRGKKAEATSKRTRVLARQMGEMPGEGPVRIVPWDAEEASRIGNIGQIPSEQEVNREALKRAAPPAEAARAILKAAAQEGPRPLLQHLPLEHLEPFAIGLKHPETPPVITQLRSLARRLPDTPAVETTHVDEETGRAAVEVTEEREDKRPPVKYQMDLVFRGDSWKFKAIEKKR